MWYKFKSRDLSYIDDTIGKYVIFHDNTAQKLE